ncbi:MAG TPA: SLC13 family permease [Anaerolineae bacterium]|nr:SLC13 family permease [Anaerolineae bacterium]
MPIEDLSVTPSGILLLALLGIAVLFFITEWLRADLVALLLLVALGATGILTQQEALSGFSRSAVITILAIFILTAGLARTGATRALSRHLMRWGGRGELSLIVVLMTAGALLSLFMNNIAAAAVLLPVAVGISRERKISPSKLLMPLAFGTILGGMATLLTTSNILVSAALRDANYPGFGLLDFAPIGVPLVVVGILYMTLIGYRLLPRRAPADWTRLLTTSQLQLAEVYGLGERWVCAHVPETSPLAGRTLSEVGLGRKLGVNVVAVLHQTKARLAPPPTERLCVGDEVYVQAREEQIGELRTRGLAIRPGPASLDRLMSEKAGLFEVVLAPRSGAVGKTLRAIHFREKYDLSVIAIWRKGRPRRVGIADIPLQLGDALLVLGPRDRARVVQSEGDFIVLADTVDESLRTARMPWAIAIMAVTIVVAAVGGLPTGEAMLAGALAMVLTGALTMDEAYRSIEWKSIFLIAAMLPVGIAMTKTGVASVLGERLVALLGGLGPLAVAGGLLAIATLLTQVTSGPAVAVLLAPIAIHAAETLQVNPRGLALAVAYGCSLAFMTPLGHPVNVLVMGPGGYKFNDFLRIGTLLTLILIAVIILLLSLVQNG